MKIRFVDLFAGIGGIRVGLAQAVAARGDNPECVFTSEIKPHAIKVLTQNHAADTIRPRMRIKVETHVNFKQNTICFNIILFFSNFVPLIFFAFKIKIGR